MSKKLVFIDFIQRTIDKEMEIWDATPQNFNSEKHYLSARQKYQNKIVKRIVKEHNSKIENSKKNELKAIYDIYGENVLDSDKKYPIPWMEDDEEFVRMMSKEKFFCDILNHIWDISTHTLTKSLQTKVHWKKQSKIEHIKKTNKPIRREFILFSIDYDYLSKEINLSISGIKKYLQRFVEYGIILDVGGGRGTKHPKIYAFGTWQKNPKTGIGKKPFLTKETHLESLRNFSLRKKEKLSITLYLKSDQSYT